MEGRPSPRKGVTAPTNDNNQRSKNYPNITHLRSVVASSHESQPQKNVTVPTNNRRSERVRISPTFVGSVAAGCSANSHKIKRKRDTAPAPANTAFAVKPVRCANNRFSANKGPHKRRIPGTLTLRLTTGHGVRNLDRRQSELKPKL